MVAAVCPTSSLSVPWMVITVLRSTFAVIPFGSGNRTGWLKPRVRVRTFPCTSAR